MSEFKPRVISGAETTVVSTLGQPVNVDGMELALEYVQGRADEIREGCSFGEDCEVLVRHQILGDGVRMARSDIYNTACGNPNCPNFTSEDETE